MRLARRVNLALLCGSFCLTSAPSPAQATKSASPTPSGSPSSGFAIESEMLTYRALQSNSETIACNIAAYIFQHPVRVSGSGKNQTCSVEKSDIDAGVLIMPFDQNVVSSFQAWRADMALMAGLKKRTAKYCGKQDSSTPL